MNPHSHHVFVSIGANLTDQNGRQALATCQAAVEALRAIPGLRMQRMSRWYETCSIPPGAPPYVNGVAWLQGEADPAVLLCRLQRIEELAGRTRPYPNAPRTLDLDIIAIGDMVRDAPDPILPHPRAHLRRFVLEPLAEIAPFWMHSRCGLNVSQLLAQLPQQGVRLLSL
jgi:2-amino-4-hydroxy-6-hydroxymethyldihydropteridine diphosphokinase